MTTAAMSTASYPIGSACRLVTDHSEPVACPSYYSSNSAEVPAVKLAYGYLRVEDCDDEEIYHLELDIQKLVEAEGFYLIAICSEYQPGYYGTFYRLTEELRQTQAQHVVVPSLDHLSPHPLLRDQLLRRLNEANAQVWTVER